MVPKFLSPDDHVPHVFRDPLCLPFALAISLFGFRIFIFGFFPREPLAASGSMFRTTSKRQSLSKWFQLCDTIFPVFRPHIATEGRCPSGEGQAMTDMQESLDKLRADAAEFLMMSVLATDAQQRRHFARLSDHFSVLASEIARAIAGRADLTPHG